MCVILGERQFVALLHGRNIKQSLPGQRVNGDGLLFNYLDLLVFDLYDDNWQQSFDRKSRINKC